MKRIMPLLFVAILIITMVGTALARSYVQCLNCGADATVTSYGPWERKTNLPRPRVLVCWEERTVTLTCTNGHTTTFKEKKNETTIDNSGGHDRPGLYVTW